MTFRPLRSAWRSMTRITARTRSSNGQCAPSDCNSSSLMKSMPAAHRTSTSSAVCSGVKPIDGLTIVPINGLPLTPAELASAVDAEFGAGISARKRVRQPHIENAQTRELFELEQIAGDSRHQVGQ